MAGKKTLAAWLKENRYSDVLAAEKISEILAGKPDGKLRSVSNSMVGMVKRKERTPSGELALAIWEFTGKEVALDEILS